MGGSRGGGLRLGGVVAVADATGLSPTTIRKGQLELLRRVEQLQKPVPARVRRAGAGRKSKTEEDLDLVQALEKLVDPLTRGDPHSPLRWTCKRPQTLARELTAQGHGVSETPVRRLLHVAGYSLQGNCKTREGTAHPDRNAQFLHINAVVEAFQARDHPVISVDTKKKELVLCQTLILGWPCPNILVLIDRIVGATLIFSVDRALVGDFRNAGREWQPQGEPEKVRVPDFVDKTLGKAIPYGGYDITENQG